MKPKHKSKLLHIFIQVPDQGHGSLPQYPSMHHVVTGLTLANLLFACFVVSDWPLTLKRERCLPGCDSREGGSRDGHGKLPRGKHLWTQHHKLLQPTCRQPAGGPVHRRDGSGGGCSQPPHPPYCAHQRCCHHRHLHHQEAPSAGQLPHLLSGRHRLSGGTPGDAHQHPLHHHGVMVPGSGGMWDVVEHGHDLLHMLHLAPMRHRPGPVLGHHQSYRVRSQEVGTPCSHHGGDSLGHLSVHIHATLILEAEAEKRWSPTVHHRAWPPGLHYILYFGGILYSHDHHSYLILQDLQRC